MSLDNEDFLQFEAHSIFLDIKFAKDLFKYYFKYLFKFKVTKLLHIAKLLKYY